MLAEFLIFGKTVLFNAYVNRKIKVHHTFLCSEMTKHQKTAFY